MAAFWNRNQPMYLLIFFILVFSYPLMQYILWKLACEQSALITDERKRKAVSNALNQKKFRVHLSLAAYGLLFVIWMAVMFLPR